MGSLEKKFLKKSISIEGRSDDLFDASANMGFATEL